MSVPRADLATTIRLGEQRLAAAGVPSPRADAELLAALVLRCSRGELVAATVRGDWLNPPQLAFLTHLLDQRVARVPLQHLTGRAPFRRLELAVGPGVFVPRPETEVLVQAVLDELAELDEVREPAAQDGEPLVVDLCTGSAAIALAVADEAPQARVVALELDPAALVWAARNVAEYSGGGVGPVAGQRVELREGDVAGAGGPGGVLADLVGRVDVVVSNPPYIPDDAVPLDPEVAVHDPALALFGGGVDGMTVPAAVVETARALLRPGGLLLMEHADVQGAVTRALVVGAWHEVVTLPDLTGRDRVLRARRPR